MAALSANADPLPRPTPQIPFASFYYPATGVDEFYLGAVVCITDGAGTVNAVAANADQTIGFCMERVTTAASTPVRVAISGTWWVQATLLADAALLTTCHAKATSDNPSEIVVTAAGAPAALGLLIHVDVTTVSGWIDLDRRNISTNA